MSNRNPNPQDKSNDPQDKSNDPQNERNAPSDQDPDSERLKEQVCNALEDNGHVDASKIEVEVSDCDVTLTGLVSNLDEKREAEKCVESLRGIRDVHNHLLLDDDDVTRSEQAARAAKKTIP